MKKLALVCSLALVVLAGTLLVACGSAPRTKDTSAVAGVYYQHEGDAADGLVKVTDKITLNSDGTWVGGESGDNGEHSQTFTIKGIEINLYLGTSRMMFGTIDADGKLELKVFVIIGWEDVVFYKEVPEEE